MLDYSNFTQSVNNILIGVIVLLVTFLLNACHQEPAQKNKDKEIIVETNNQSWPRTISTAKGELTILQKPQRIVSTSVTITGTLLAIKAPVIASGGTKSNTSVADKNGFFMQWAEVAETQKIKPLYQLEANAEAVAGQAPDLIIVSATGGDSALKLYDQFTAIAPTLVINYDDKSWQQLAELLGEVTGHEEAAKEIIAEFDERALKVKKSIKLPQQPTTAMVYYTDGTGANIWTVHSAQGHLLKTLGFSLAKIPASLQNNHSMGIRSDIVPITGERLTEGLTGKTILLFSTNEQSIKQVMMNKFLKNIPAVQRKQVYSMGADTFRLDYYSSMNMLKRIETLFGKNS